MRKTVQVLLLLVMLAAAIWIIIDSRQIADTGTGNGAAILWDNEFEAFVSSLSANCENDMEKVTVYREWVIENISYDYACETLFYQTFDVKTVLQKRKGVCFDYACLFAAMCRSQGIPCYVLDGTYRTDNTFRHAWNRVYAEGQWWSIDATRDCHRKRRGAKKWVYSDWSGPESGRQIFHSSSDILAVGRTNGRRERIE